MTEPPVEIIGHLLHIRSVVDAIREDVCELNVPIGAFECRYLTISSRLDSIEGHIERIVRRLDLTDA